MLHKAIQGTQKRDLSLALKRDSCLRNTGEAMQRPGW